MSGVLVFIPVAPEQARRLCAGAVLEGLQAFTVNRALLAALELGSDAAEDAEHGAMVLASLHGLAQHGLRLVLVAEVAPAAIAAGAETHNGGVRVERLSLAQVQSFFTDPAGQPLVARAAQAAAGLEIDEAWQLDEVQQMLGDCDLLWHAAEELPQIENEGGAR